jgi:hypothetical protein
MSSCDGVLDTRVPDGDLVARGTLSAGYRSMCGLGKGILVGGGSDTETLVVGDSHEPGHDVGHNMHDLTDGEGGGLSEGEFDRGVGILGRSSTGSGTANLRVREGGGGFNVSRRPGWLYKQPRWGQAR